MYRILVLGYDERSRYLCSRLKTKCSVSVDYFEPDNFNFNNIKDNNYQLIILPIPTRLSEDNILSGYNVSLSNVLDNWNKSNYVYATIRKNPLFKNVDGVSLLEDEEFVLKNAYDCI